MGQIIIQSKEWSDNSELQSFATEDNERTAMATLCGSKRQSEGLCITLMMHVQAVNDS